MPGWENAQVEDSKIFEYLLNLQHPDGKEKANLFLKSGFHLDKLADFKAFLINHAMTHQVVKAEQPKLITAYPLTL